MISIVCDSYISIFEDLPHVRIRVQKSGDEIYSFGDVFNQEQVLPIVDYVNITLKAFSEWVFATGHAEKENATYTE